MLLGPCRADSWNSWFILLLLASTGNVLINGVAHSQKCAFSQQWQDFVPQEHDGLAVRAGTKLNNALSRLPLSCKQGVQDLPHLVLAAASGEYST